MSTVTLTHQAVASLTPEEFSAAADDPRTVVVDLREADERVASGSIAHAVHVPRGLLEFRADPTSAAYDARLRPDARVLLYCSDGARSTLAAMSLRTLGYTDVAVLCGGLAAWGTARLPLVGRMPSPY
jgi:rhodanese-related sulfurtransferase